MHAGRREALMKRFSPLGRKKKPEDFFEILSGL
jgi:hypothetical protein